MRTLWIVLEINKESIIDGLDDDAYVFPTRHSAREYVKERRKELNDFIKFKIVKVLI
jgi:hypothetical protein